MLADNFYVRRNMACPALGWLTAAVVFAAGLSACATGVEMTRLPARIDYVCAKDKILAVSRSPDQRVARVLIGDKEVGLFRAESAAQEKYTDGRYSLYLDGEQAMLEEQGRVLYGPCVSPVPLPKYYRQ